MYVKFEHYWFEANNHLTKVTNKWESVFTNLWLQDNLHPGVPFLSKYLTWTVYNTYLTFIHELHMYTEVLLSFLFLLYLVIINKNLRTNLPYLLYVQYQIQIEWKRPQDFQQRFVFQSQGENLYLLLLLITENKNKLSIVITHFLENLLRW